MALYDMTGEAQCAQVWLYKPVAAQDQAYSLLAQGQVDEALPVLRDALDAGHAWAVTGCAEAAMLLIHGAPSARCRLHASGRLLADVHIVDLRDCLSA